MIEQQQSPTLPIHGVMPRFSSVLSLFDGMSCGQIALNRVGIKYDNYFSSEIDKHAIKVTQTNYPKTIQLGDVREIKAENLPKIDLLIGGSPQVAEDLLIVGDTWCLERHEYDGSEWWEYKELPKEPTETIALKAVTVEQAEQLNFDVSCGWENLLSLNGMGED